MDELREYLNTSPQLDLCFFDIQLNDGIIFDVLNDRTIMRPIIFTTAYDQYAVKVFKQNSIDYLLKPIDKDELEQAIGKFRKSRST